MSPYGIFWRGQRPLYTQYTFDPFDMSKMSNITLYIVTNTTFDPLDMSNMSNN